MIMEWIGIVAVDLPLLLNRLLGCSTPLFQSP
jgi:hypothetical protein